MPDCFLRRSRRALLLSSFLLCSGVGCKPSRDPQTQLQDALLPLCRALPGLASQMAQPSLPAKQAAPLLRSGLEPYRSRFAALSAQYQALSPLEKRRLMASVSRNCATELRAFYVALSRVTVRFRSEDEAKDLVRSAVESWRDSHALWAFELFAQDTVAELKEMAEEDEAEEKDEEEKDGDKDGSDKDGNDKDGNDKDGSKNDDAPAQRKDASIAKDRSTLSRQPKEPAHAR